MGFKAVQPHTAEVDAWMAAANREPKTARDALDIAGRYRDEIPVGQRLDTVGVDRMEDMMHRGGEDDQRAAVYEILHRDGVLADGEAHTGKQLRWTQIRAVAGLLNDARTTSGSIVDNVKARVRIFLNMRAGEGKSLVYYAYAALKALRISRAGDDAVKYITTRDPLADRDFAEMKQLFEPYGFDIHRMNDNGDVPAPKAGRPTIYVGTVDNVLYSALKEKPIPGRHAVIDESDEALVYKNGYYMLTEGMTLKAPTALREDIKWAWNFVKSHSSVDDPYSGAITPLDFGRVLEKPLDPLKLTDAGLAKVERLEGKPLSDLRRILLDRAAKCVGIWSEVRTTRFGKAS